MTETVQEAAAEAWVAYTQEAQNRSGLSSYAIGWQDAFALGAGWQYGRDAAAAFDTDTAFKDEIRNAIGTLGEGMAEALKLLKQTPSGYHVKENFRAVLLNLQEIGDTNRRVEGMIGDKFGVVLDAIKHVGETTEAVLDQVMPQEVVGYTEPMHADVKAAPVDDASGLGRLWADVPLRLEEVSDKTLKELFLSEQIPTSRYMEEIKRREKPSHFERVDTDKIAIGEPFEVADLRNQLRIAKMLEAFWRKTAAARGGRIKTLADQVMDMGEMVDDLTGRVTGA